MGFTKLDSGIIHSSVWSEPYYTRIVWITLLAMANSDGVVGASVSGLSRAANVTIDECMRSLTILESPDNDSRSSDNDGKRIEKIEGGWIILNYKKYRDYTYSSNPESVRKREYRQRDILGHVPELTGHSASISVSVDKEKNEEDCKEKKERNVIPPKLEWITDYCNERQNNIIPQKFFDYYQSRGWMIGKNKMKDWQAAVRTWEQNNKEKPVFGNTGKTMEEMYG